MFWDSKKSARRSIRKRRQSSLKIESLEERRAMTAVGFECQNCAYVDPPPDLLIPASFVANEYGSDIEFLKKNAGSGTFHNSSTGSGIPDDVLSLVQSIASHVSGLAGGMDFGTADVIGLLNSANNAGSQDLFSSDVDAESLNPQVKIIGLPYNTVPNDDQIIGLITGNGEHAGMFTERFGEEPMSAVMDALESMQQQRGVAETGAANYLLFFGMDRSNTAEDINNWLSERGTNPFADGASDSRPQEQTPDAEQPAKEGQIPDQESSDAAIDRGAGKNPKQPDTGQSRWSDKADWEHIVDPVVDAIPAPGKAVTLPYEAFKLILTKTCLHATMSRPASEAEPIPDSRDAGRHNSRCG